MFAEGALRKPGRWRSIVVAGGLALAFAPALPLLFAALAHVEPEPSMGAFWSALLRGAYIAIVTALIGFVVGLPTGLALALHRFPLRRLLVLTLAMGLVLPSFLTAIGLSMLSHAAWPGRLPRIRVGDLSGWPGTVWALAPVGVALVAFATYAATRHITASQIGAARLAGGESAVLRQSARAVWPISALAAAFAGILALSDPGPGLVFGHHGAAAEILTTFSAQYDFHQAARQCLLLAAVVAALALPCAAKLAPLLGNAILARDTKAASAVTTSWTTAEAVGAFSLMLFLLGMPLLGLLFPLAHDFPFGRALADAGRTAGYTALYALSAGLISTFVGFVLALSATHSQRMQTSLVTGVLVLIALPPAFTALGWVQLGALTPERLDWLMRGGPLLALHLGLRLLPVATLLALRAINSASPSWLAAAELHGVRPWTCLRKILIPWAAPALWTATGTVALLALADVTSALLLHAPGRGTVPLTIFSVMANAPEAYVAALCLVYLLGSAGVVALCMRAVQRWH